MTKNKVVRGVGWSIFCLIFLWQGCQNSSSEHAKLLHSEALNNDDELRRNKCRKQLVTKQQSESLHS